MGQVNAHAWILVLTANFESLRAQSPKWWLARAWLPSSERQQNGI